MQRKLRTGSEHDKTGIVLGYFFLRKKGGLHCAFLYLIKQRDTDPRSPMFLIISWNLENESSNFQICAPYYEATTSC